MDSNWRTARKAETPAIDFWLNQFRREDRGDAKQLLAAVRNVPAGELHDSMTEIIRSRVIAKPAPVGLFVESERGHRGGRAYLLFKEQYVGSDPVT